MAKKKITKKNIEKFPGGGALDYQMGFKGFGVGPQYYQDNNYFRTVMPENAESMSEQINAPSFMSNLADIGSKINQGVQGVSNIMNNFNMSSNGIDGLKLEKMDSFMSPFKNNYEATNPEIYNTVVNNTKPLTGDNISMSSLGLGQKLFMNGGPIMKYDGGGDIKNLYSQTKADIEKYFPQGAASSTIKSLEDAQVYQKQLNLLKHYEGILNGSNKPIPQKEVKNVYEEPSKDIPNDFKNIPLDKPVVKEDESNYNFDNFSKTNIGYKLPVVQEKVDSNNLDLEQIKGILYNKLSQKEKGSFNESLSPVNNNFSEELYTNKNVNVNENKDDLELLLNNNNVKKLTSKNDYGFKPNLNYIELLGTTDTDPYQLKDYVEKRHKQGIKDFMLDIEEDAPETLDLLNSNFKNYIDGLGKKLNSSRQNETPVQKMYNGTGRQSLAFLGGNSYGNTGTNRFGKGSYTNAVSDDFLHNKVRVDRQRYEDDKVDWGFMDWAKDPVSFGAGMLGNSIIGDITGLDDVVNNSWMGRSTAGKLGSGWGKTTTGLGKVAAGVFIPGQQALIADGIGDIGQGTVGTIGSLNADSAMRGYDKSGYVSGKRLQNDMDYFNSLTDNIGSMMGGVKSISGNINNMGGFGNMFSNMKFAGGGDVFEAPGSKVPIQAESYEGQPEQVVLPDNTIKSTNATTSHENMGDNTVTDVLPEGSHIQSSRNKLSPEEIKNIVSQQNPEMADAIMKKIDQVYKDKYGKKKNKEIAPSDISEYAKNKYQNKTTPNSFKTEDMKKGNKLDYIELSKQLNELLKAGQESSIMKNGGNVMKYDRGTNLYGVQNSNYFNGNRNFTSVAPEEGYISGTTRATGYLDAQGNFVALDTYQPWYMPKGVKDYDPNQIRTDEERANANSKNRFNNYQNPSWKGSTWDPGSPEAYRWFRDNFITLKNVLSEKEFNDLESAYDKIIGDPKNPGHIKKSVLKNSKGYQDALKKAQKIRQIAVDKLNPDFNKNITAKSVAPTWETIQDLQGNKAFVDKLKQYGIDSTNKGTYGQIANLDQKALADIYSTITDPKDLEILNKGNNLDAQWDRRTQRFIPQIFSSNAEKDAWMKSQGLNEAYGWGYDPNNPNNIIVPEVYRSKEVSEPLKRTFDANTSEQSNKTADQGPFKNISGQYKTYDNYFTGPTIPEEGVQLGEMQSPNPINPTNLPMDKRTYSGLLEKQLGYGLQGNEAMFNAGMGQNPLYYMETPDTYIRSRINELPVNNVLYNIERSARNQNEFLRDNTGDWSTLAGNTLNNAANMYNQIGDQLSAINEKNVGLYNTTQDKQQGLLENNMTVRNRNLKEMQDMINFKTNLQGTKAVKDAEMYSSYYDKLNENKQKEDNQKLAMLSLAATNPDSFKGEKGQQLYNTIMGTTGSYNNGLTGFFGTDLLGNSLSNITNRLFK